jgi:Chemotaxis phosphatase CheX
MLGKMSRLPSPEDLAKLVSYVFDVMLTLRCELVGRRPVREGETTQDRLQGLAWRTAVLPIDGNQPLTVALSSDEQGCLALGAALFACAKTAVDLEMIDDTLRELVNMIGGQVRSAIAKDHSLGLARIDATNHGGIHQPEATYHECVVLRAGTFELAVQVSA